MFAYTVPLTAEARHQVHALCRPGRTAT